MFAAPDLRPELIDGKFKLLVSKNVELFGEAVTDDAVPKVLAEMGVTNLDFDQYQRELTLPVGWQVDVEMRTVNDEKGNQRLSVDYWPTGGKFHTQLDTRFSAGYYESFQLLVIMLRDQQKTSSHHLAQIFLGPVDQNPHREHISNFWSALRVELCDVLCLNKPAELWAEGNVSERWTQALNIVEKLDREHCEPFGVACWFHSQPDNRLYKIKQG